MSFEDEYQELMAKPIDEISDFVGWISIDGTNINYPVMQTVDNPNYYLKRGFEKQHSNGIVISK